MNLSRFIGCILIIVGTSIGAGILLLPVVAAGPGFILSTISILAFWVLMTTTGLLIVEMNLALKTHACTFSSMAEKTLGIFGRVITWLAYLLLLYSTVAGYMAGESSLIAAIIEQLLHITMPNWTAAIAFTIMLGVAVFWSTGAVDHFNRGLISIKGFLLISSLILTLPQIDISKLILGQDIERAKYLLAASPILLCIFNFHFVIPSLRMYVGSNPNQLKWIIILGTTISLILYLLWTISTLGIVPLTGDNSFASMEHLGRPADSPDFIKIMTTIVKNKWVTASINGFFNASMTTSFLGVSLGLFDFLADGFKRKNTLLGRLQTSCLTFIPPLLFTLFYPHGFHMAMNYSACFIAILCLILPALMVYRLRKNTELRSPYRVTICNNTVLWLIMGLGSIFFVFPILTNLHLLPHIK